MPVKALRETLVSVRLEAQRKPHQFNRLLRAGARVGFSEGVPRGQRGEGKGADMSEPDLLEHGEPIFWGIISEWLARQSHDTVDEVAVRQVMAKLMDPHPKCEDCVRLKDALKDALDAMDSAQSDLQYAVMMGKEIVG